MTGTENLTEENVAGTEETTATIHHLHPLIQTTATVSLTLDHTRVIHETHGIVVVLAGKIVPLIHVVHVKVLHVRGPSRTK